MLDVVLLVVRVNPSGFLVNILGLLDIQVLGHYSTVVALHGAVSNDLLAADGLLLSGVS